MPFTARLITKKGVELLAGWEKRGPTEWSDGGLGRVGVGWVGGGGERMAE